MSGGERPAPGTRIATYRGHRDGVQAVSWSADGSYLASASLDGTVQVWHADTGATIAIYRGHGADMATVAWAPNDAWIASGGMDESVQVWEALTATPVVAYKELQAWVQSVSWSRSNGQLAAATDRGLHVWAPPETEIRAHYAESDGDAVAFSVDGRFLACSTHDPSIHIRDAADGRMLTTYAGHEKWVPCVAWAPTGEVVASTCADGTVHVWRADTGRLVRLYRGHQTARGAFVYSAAWSPDARLLASGGGVPSAARTYAPNSYDAQGEGDSNTIQIWEAATGKQVFSYYGHDDLVHTVAWSPDGAYIASGSWDGMVQVWSAP